MEWSEGQGDVHVHGDGNGTLESAVEVVMERDEAAHALALREKVFRDTIEVDRDEYFGGKALDAAADLEENEVPIIRMNNIHKTYLLGVEGVPALRGVSLSVRRGEFLCIFGTSGGGKTTMLNMMGTIDKPTKGELYIADSRITYDTSDKLLSTLRLKNIGFVFQTFNLLSSLTAIENVEMPMILAGDLSRSERRERARMLLTRVGMAERLDHFPSQLSGGEQQRVTIARAVANNPDVLLLDEPTGDLDTVNTAIVMKLLTELNAEGHTLIMVTHDVGLKFYADRIIWMRDGKIQRIEKVSSEKQKETLAQLDADLESLHVTVESHAGDGKKLEEEVAFHHFKDTDLRMPTDYQTNEHFDPGHGGSLSSFTKFTAAMEKDSGISEVVVEK